LPPPDRNAPTHGRELPAGRCACGAFFVFDQSGKSAGQAQIDLRTLACGGDVDRGLKLRADEDFDLRSKALGAQTIQGRRVVRGHPYLQPKVWALELR